MKRILLAALAVATLFLSPALAAGPYAFRPQAIAIDSGTKTAAATSGAATLNKSAGVITSEALTTAAAASYTLTLTDSQVAAGDQVFASVQYGTSTTGTPVITKITPGAGSVVIVVQNIHASAALNGTIKISFFVLKN
jgi:hypothetical protein